jgi:hypothetical protein
MRLRAASDMSATVRNAPPRLRESFQFKAFANDLTDSSAPLDYSGPHASSKKPSAPNVLMVEEMSTDFCQGVSAALKQPLPDFPMRAPPYRKRPRCFALWCRKLQQ